MRGKAFFLPNYKEDELELLFCDILPDHGDKNIFSWSTERSHLYCFADLFGCHFCRLLQICNVSIYRQTQSPNQLLKHNSPTTHYQKSDRKPVKSLYKTQTCSTSLSLQHWGWQLAWFILLVLFFITQIAVEGSSLNYRKPQSSYLENTKPVFDIKEQL